MNTDWVADASTTNVTHPGSSSIQVEANGLLAPFEVHTKLFASGVVTGADYTLSFDILALVIPPLTNLTVEVYDGVTSAVYFTQLVPSGTVGNVLVNFTLPANSGDVRIRFIGPASNMGSFISFDNVLLSYTQMVQVVQCRDLEGYRFGFNGMEKDNEAKGLGNSLDFGARIYDSRLGRFLSIDPKANNFPSLSSYLFAINCPITFIDINGEYAGQKMRTTSSFIEIMRLWAKEAEKQKMVTVFYGMDIRYYETQFEVITRVFNHDVTAATSDQFIKKVHGIEGKAKDGSFSYYQNIGNDENGPFIDVGGFPLDIKHFMKNVGLGTTLSQSKGSQIGIYEELWQGIDPKATPDALTSSFSPEDLLSNELGLIFSRYGQNGDFVGDLEAFLKEAATLIKTNDLKNGKYITAADITHMRAVMLKYYGTNDFKDFIAGACLYNAEGMATNRQKNIDNMTPEERTKVEVYGKITGTIRSDP